MTQKPGAQWRLEPLRPRVTAIGWNWLCGWAGLRCPAKLRHYLEACPRDDALQQRLEDWQKEARSHVKSLW